MQSIIKTAVVQQRKKSPLCAQKICTVSHRLLSPQNCFHYTPLPRGAAKEDKTLMRATENEKKTNQWIKDLLSWMGVRRDNDLYEDCVQEAWLAIHSQDARKRSNEAYRKQAAKWAVLCFLNRESAEAHKGLRMQSANLLTLEDMVIMEMDKDQGFKAIAESLSVRESFVYILTAYAPLSQKQIGDIMGLTTRHVRRLLHSARRKVAALDAARDQAENAAQLELASAGGILG
jgi:RNA polymerase sigma factor (sigma-70 family)